MYDALMRMLSHFVIDPITCLDVGYPV